MMDAIVERLTLIEDRQQIQDVIYRYCRAMDRNDLALFRTVFWEDGGYDSSITSAAARDFAEPMMIALKHKYEATQHMIGNILIDLQGDLAFVESYVTAYHRSLPTPESNESVLGPAWLERIDTNASHDLLIGARYFDRFEKRSGEWRIALRSLIFDWSQVQPSNDRHFGALNPSSLQGKRGRDDVTYQRESA